MSVANGETRMTEDRPFLCHPSFSFERPARLAKQSGRLFMCCSDFPHSEGTATPIADYAAIGADADQDPALFHDNVAFLLGDASR